jgi:hypothetical protein
MPLNTTIKRNGRARKIRWGHFHIAAMALAAAIDGGDIEGSEGELHRLLREGEPTIFESTEIALGPGDVFNLVGYHILAATPLNSGPYTMKNEMTFIDTTDDEHLVFKPGDVLSASRGW